MQPIIAVPEETTGLLTTLAWGFGLLAILTAVFLSARKWLRRVDEVVRRQEDHWALTQLAQMLAQRSGQSAEAVLHGLQAGEPKVLPSDFRNAVLRYERQPQAQSGQQIRKTLQVDFVDQAGRAQKATLETTMDWLDLPAEVRAEMIQTGKEVVREFGLPRPAGPSNPETNHVE